MKQMALALFATSFFTGCTLTSLGDGLEQASCIEQPFSFCDELNTTTPSASSEQEWRCDTSEGVCALLSLDMDNDGVGKDADCDDNNAMRSPNLSEICDGIDNDCNDLVDDGNAWSVHPEDTPLVQEGANVFFENVDIAQDTTSKETVVVYQILENAKNLPHGIAIDGSDGSKIIDDHITLENMEIQTQSLAISAQNGGTFEALIGSKSGDRDMVFAELNVGASSLNATAENTLENSGVGTTQNRLSSNGNRTLASYQLANPNNEDGCGSIGSQGTLKDVFVVNPKASTLSPIAIGQTEDPSPAALISVASNRWLIAYADAVDQGVTLYSIAMDNNGSLLTSDSPLLQIPSTGVTGQVNIAASEDKSKIAVVYRDGCGNSDIGLVLADYDVQNNTLSSTYTDPLDRPRTSIHPDVAWLDSPTNGWIVSFDELRTKTFAMLFGEDGTPISSELEIDPSGESGSRINGPRIIQGFNSNRFAIINPIRNSTSQSEIRMTQLSCNLN